MGDATNTGTVTRRDLEGNPYYVATVTIDGKDWHRTFETRLSAESWVDVVLSDGYVDAENGGTE